MVVCSKQDRSSDRLARLAIQRYTVWWVLLFLHHQEEDLRHQGATNQELQSPYEVLQERAI